MTLLDLFHFSRWDPVLSSFCWKALDHLHWTEVSQLKHTCYKAKISPLWQSEIDLLLPCGYKFLSVDCETRAEQISRSWTCYRRHVSSQAPFFYSWDYIAFLSKMVRFLLLSPLWQFGTTTNAFHIQPGCARFLTEYLGILLMSEGKTVWNKEADWCVAA